MPGIVAELYVENTVGQGGQVLVTDLNEATGRKWGAVDLTSSLAVSGALPIANGGTGQTTLAQLGVMSGAMRHIGGSGITALKIAGQFNATALTTTAMVANTLYAVPLIESCVGGTMNNIWVEVTTGAAKSNVAIGVYSATSRTNLYPSALVFDSGTLSSAAAAVLSATDGGGFGTAFAPGLLHWLVLLGDGAPTMRTLPVAAAYPLFGMGTGFGANPNVGLTKAQTFGALPNPFPAAATAITTGFLPALAIDWLA